jgi:bifunctional non-homologous end joining protein LigD
MKLMALVRKASPFIKPLQPRQQERPPSGTDWIHEIKWDGYRVQAHLAGGKVAIFTRQGKDGTRQFQPIAAAIAILRARRAILDGEAAVSGDSGRTDFHALRRHLDGRSAHLRFYAFDLREWPLLERKAKLQALLAHAPEILVYVKHMRGDATRILDHACRFGHEGIVSKRATSPYRSGRSDFWVKTKCERSDIFVVVGFASEPGARRPRVVRLHLAREAGECLVYAGSVEVGIDDTNGRALHAHLAPLVQRGSPLSAPVTGVKPKWVRPELRVEVAYPNASDDGHLRHPKFKGLRDDLRGQRLTAKPPR